MLHRQRFVIHALLIGLSLLHLCARSQPTTHGWGAVFLNGPFRNRWGVYLDAQIRSAEQSKYVKSWLIRPALQLKLGAQDFLFLGYAFVGTDLRTTEKIGFLPEHRIWEQWTHLQPIMRFNLQHRLRLEHRFIGRPRYDAGIVSSSPSIYSTRFRYFNRMIVPWSFQRNFTQGPFACLQNELFLNLTGKQQLNGHIYDQNRFYVSMGYRFNRSVDAEAGYMRRETRLRNGSSFQHIWQVAMYLRR